MKVEYVAEGSVYTPLMRLYDFNASEATLLMTGIVRLANSELTEADLQSFVPAESVGNCSLTFVTDSTDRGIEPLKQSGAFVCVMSRKSWADMVEYIEPFCHEQHAHSQRLTGYDSYIEIPLLLSTDGHW